MKKKLALIMTMSLLLTSVSPVNAAGTEVIEIAEEENLSASFTEDEEDPEIEIVEDPETVPEADVSDEEVIPEEDGTDDEIFTEDMSLEDVSGLIEDEDAGNGMISEIFSSEPVPVGDAEDGYGRADHGELLMSAASEPDGPEYYGSQLAGNQKAMYELLKTGNWQLGTSNSSGEIPYTMAYSPDTDYSFELESTDYASSEVYKSIRQKLYSDAYTAFDAYLYDYPEESFWIDRSGFGFAVSYNPYETAPYHFSIIKMRLNAYERWTGAKKQLADLETYTDRSVAQIQAVDGYSTMTPGEKLKAVHDHICDLVSYGDASTTIEAQHTPYGAYDFDHKVVCEGYSKLFKILVDKLGITDNVLVSGIAYSPDGSGGPHMWNVVSLESSWYLLDATWDDQDESSTVYYDYFLAGSGSKGFSYWTIGEEHEAHANLSNGGGEFITPTLSVTMYHQRKQTGVTATCTEAGSATIVCGLHPKMGGGYEVPPETETIPAMGHQPVTDAAVAATCTEPGLTEGSHCSACGMIIVSQETVAATGHSWGSPSWKWTEDHTGATATFTCKNDSSHSESIPAEISSAGTDPTCTAGGEAVYTAEVSFEGNKYTDEKTVQNSALGHDWGDATYTWTDDYTSVTAERVCTRDETHTESETVQTTSEITKAATCTEKGETTYTAVFTKEGFETQTEKVPIPEKGHVETDLPAVAATCTKTGLTAGKKCSACGEILVQQEVTAALGHAFGEWTETKPATCTEAGSEERVCSRCGEKETSGISPTGHDWGGPNWAWLDNNTRADARFTCKNDSSHVEHVPATTTQKVIKEATCGTTGTVVYMAVVEFEDNTYTGQKQATTPMADHNWGEPEYTWANDNSEVTAVRVCLNDNSHRQNRISQTTSEQTKAATCTEKGETTYTAVFNNGFETQTKTVANIDPTGHDYGAPVWKWAEDYSSATVTLTCKNDSTHIIELDGELTSEITADASYTSTGVKTYTAAAEYEGEEYQDQKTETIPVLSPSGVTDQGLSWEVADGVLTVSLKEDAQSTEIPDYAAADDAPWAEAAAELNVTKIVVKDKITKVGSNSFAGLGSLVVMELPQSLEYLADDSIDAALLSTINVIYSGTESEWETLTQGTAFRDVNMISSHTHKWGNWYQKIPATCTADAILERKCNICQTAETMTDKENPATGHDYDNPVWEWAEDYTFAKVTLTCKNDNTHVIELDGELTSEITADASYTSTGVKTYTAVAEYEGNEYQNQKTEEIPVLSPSGVTDEGLSWEIADGVLTIGLTEGIQNAEIPDYESEDDAPWAEAAAELEVSKIVVEEGITKVGANAFTGVESLDEISLPQSLKELADDSIEGTVLSTINVIYAGSESEWETLTQGTAFQDVDMTSTHTHEWGNWYQKIPATCTANAILERKCKICQMAETMTDEENPATGHDYDNPVWEWADDYSSAKVTLTCKNDSTHIIELDGELTSEITADASYTNTGVKTYTAIAEYGEKVYQDKATEVIPVLSPNGVTDEGLSWEIADGVLTIGLTEGTQNAEIPDYESEDDAPWAEAAVALKVTKIIVKEGITKVGSYAFTCRKDLSEISLPQSLEELADDSVDDTVLSTVDVNYAGSESQWERLTQGTSFQNVNMTSTHVHSWGSGVVTKPATTAAAGIRTYKCSCGKIKTEAIPRLKIVEKITVSKKPTIQKPAPAKGKITVKWKHFKNKTKNGKKIWKPIKKVQIQCATDSGFRNIVKKADVSKGKTKTTIKGLKKKTTYYVRVRYFDGVGYSAWSKVKKVKTK